MGMRSGNVIFVFLGGVGGYMISLWGWGGRCFKGILRQWSDAIYCIEKWTPCKWTLKRFRLYDLRFQSCCWLDTVKMCDFYLWNSPLSCVSSSPSPSPPPPFHHTTPACTLHDAVVPAHRSPSLQSQVESRVVSSWASLCQNNCGSSTVCELISWF